MRHKETEELLQEYLADTFKTTAQPTTTGRHHSFFVGDPQKPFLFAKLDNEVELKAQHDALQAYRRAQVSVPLIIGFTAYLEIPEMAFLMLEYVPNDVTLPHPLPLNSLGQTLKKMHDARARADDLMVPQADYIKDRSAKIRSGSDTDISDLLNSIAQFPKRESVLHMDFKFARGNVLYRNQAVCSVIDPYGVIGDPMLDVARTLLWLTDEEGREFLKGYFSDGASADDKERLEVFRRFTCTYKMVADKEKLQKRLDPSTRARYETRVERCRKIAEGKGAYLLS